MHGFGLVMAMGGWMGPQVARAATTAPGQCKLGEVRPGGVGLRVVEGMGLVEGLE